MAHIYRAFFAPMNRMNAPSGIPTKVPFLFSNILRRLIKDYQPDYLGIVFDRVTRLTMLSARWLHKAQKSSSRS